MGKQIADDDMASKRQRIERSLVDDAIAEEMQQCAKIGGSWYEQTINDNDSLPPPRVYSPANYKEEDKVKVKEDKEEDKESPVEPGNVEDREPVYQHKEFHNDELSMAAEC